MTADAPSGDTLLPKGRKINDEEREKIRHEVNTIDSLNNFEGCL
jgi:hypothetical protein